MAACDDEFDQRPEGEPAQQGQALVGGEEAAPGKFDATLFITAGGTSCTAARIGPREILTAAHCVMDVGNGNMRAGSGDGLLLTNDKVLATATYNWRRIRTVRVHPSWQAACGAGCANNVTLSAPYPADVALITTQLTLPAHIPSAKVYWGPLPKSKLVTVVGYGCENGVGQWGTSTRLQFEETAAYTLKPAGLDAAYIGTQGQNKLASEASLCPGDSGGPLYRGRSNKYIIGINAYYTFPRNDQTGISTLNTHTRLGTKSPHDVTEWLLQFVPTGGVVGPG